METYREKWQKNSILLGDQIIDDVGIDCIDSFSFVLSSTAITEVKDLRDPGKFNFKHSVSVFWKVYTKVTSCSVSSDMKQNDLLQKFYRKFT